jgi:hypothetical protein
MSAVALALGGPQMCRHDTRCQDSAPSGRAGACPLLVDVGSIACQCGTLSPPGSARAEPTPPRSRPCSDTPQSTLRPGTSDPGQPRTPKSSNESSATRRPGETVGGHIASSFSGALSSLIRRICQPGRGVAGAHVGPLGASASSEASRAYSPWDRRVRELGPEEQAPRTSPPPSSIGLTGVPK